MLVSYTNMTILLDLQSSFVEIFLFKFIFFSTGHTFLKAMGYGYIFENKVGQDFNASIATQNFHSLTCKVWLKQSTL